MLPWEKPVNNSGSNDDGNYIINNIVSLVYSLPSTQLTQGDIQ